MDKIGDSGWKKNQWRSQEFDLWGCTLEPVDGGTEGGAEARSAGAPSGVGSGEGRRSPSPVWGSGPQKIFQKST